MGFALCMDREENDKMKSKKAEKSYVLPVVAISLMAVISAVSGLNVALPSIALDTGATQTQLTWIVNSYAVIFAGLLMLAGAIGDKYGRRTILALGLAIFAIGAMLGFFANEPNALIAVRVLMGIGAAAIMPSTLSVITTSFDEAERGKAVGVWVGVAGGGGVLGLFGSAILLEFFNWNSFFLLNFTMASIGLIGTLRFIKDSKDEGGHSLDVTGGLISVLGVSSLVFGIIEGPERGWTDYLTILTLIVGILTLISFIFWELHVKNPLLDPRLFRNRGFSGGALSITIQFFGQFGFLFVGMQYLQYVAGFSALDAVLHLLPLPFVMLPMSRFAGKNAHRIPQKYMGSFGLAFFALGMFMFAQMDSDFSLIWFTSSLIIFAFGMALAAVPATTAITNSLSADKQGVASAVNDTSREFGSAIGIAVLGAALNNQYRAGVKDVASTLPSDIADHVLNSVAFTQSTPPPALAANWDVLVTTALDSFTHGMSLALNIGGAFALIGAVLVFAVAPKKAIERSSD